MRVTSEQKKIIQEITIDTLRGFLTFHVSHKAMDFIHKESTVNWRELEDRLHDGYRVKGVGVIANRRNLNVIDAEDGGFLHTEEDLYPGEVPTELSSYPYAAASSAYLFTQMELFGDQMVNIVNPNYLRNHQAWHHGVFGDMKLNTKAERDKARKGFATPFGRSHNSVPVFAVKRLAELKKLRNQFIHEGQSEIKFDDFFAKIVGTVISLYFLLVTSENEIKIYPYYDYMGKWK